MVSQRADLDPVMLQDQIELAMERYAQVHEALGIPLPRVHVGEARRAGLFTRTSVKRLFQEARQSARDRIGVR